MALQIQMSWTPPSGCSSQKLVFLANGSPAGDSGSLSAATAQYAITPAAGNNAVMRYAYYPPNGEENLEAYQSIETEVGDTGSIKLELVC